MSDLTVTVAGAGHGVITRVPGADHTADTAEIRLTVTLPADPGAAGLRLAALTTHLRALIGPPRTEHRPHRRDTA
jgi:hypothetical protein